MDFEKMLQSKTFYGVAVFIVTLIASNFGVDMGMIREAALAWAGYGVADKFN